MEIKEKILIFVPVLMMLTVIFGVFINSKNGTSVTVTSSSSTLDNFKSESCVDCPSTLSCSDTSYPVLGGLDFVMYFTDFKLEDGTYDETRSGEAGDASIKSVYNGYTFNFVSVNNKALFDTNPSQYIPQ